MMGYFIRKLTKTQRQVAKLATLQATQRHSSPTTTEFHDHRHEDHQGSGAYRSGSPGGCGAVPSPFHPGENTLVLPALAPCNSSSPNSGSSDMFFQGTTTLEWIEGGGFKLYVKDHRGAAAEVNSCGTAPLGEGANSVLTDACQMNARAAETAAETAAMAEKVADLQLCGAQHQEGLVEAKSDAIAARAEATRAVAATLTLQKRITSMAVLLQVKRKAAVVLNAFVAGRCIKRKILAWQRAAAVIKALVVGTIHKFAVAGARRYINEWEEGRRWSRLERQHYHDDWWRIMTTYCGPSKEYRRDAFGKVKPVWSIHFIDGINGRIWVIVPKFLERTGVVCHRNCCQGCKHLCASVTGSEKNPWFDRAGCKQ